MLVWRRRLKWIGRAALFGLLLFGGLEAALRIFPPSSLDYYRKLKLLHVFHPDYLVGLEPGASYYLKHNNGLWEGQFTINSLGYRGSPELAPEAGESVLGCLGDSLVMGFGVSDGDTFCRMLDGTADASGVLYRTQNFGVDAFGSHGYAERLKEALEPGRLPGLKTVLLFISPNDFTLPQALRDRGILADDETDALRADNPGFREAFRVQFLLTRYFFSLHAASVARHQLRIRRAGLQQNMRRELVESGLLRYQPEIDGEIPADQRDSLNYLARSFYRPPPRPACTADNIPVAQPAAAPGPTAQAIPAAPQCPQPVPLNVSCAAREPAVNTLEALPEITRQSYARMIAMSRKAGVRLVVVFLPVQMETLHCEMNGRYSRFFTHALRAGAYFREQGIATIDLRKYIPEMCGSPLLHADGSFRKHSSVEDYIIQGDGHLTVAGNRWAADGLRRELRRLKLSNQAQAVQDQEPGQADAL